MQKIGDQSPHDGPRIAYRPRSSGSASPFASLRSALGGSGVFAVVALILALAFLAASSGQAALVAAAVILLGLLLARRQLEREREEFVERALVLEQAGERFRTILDSITDAVFVIDRQGAPIYVNRQFERLFGMRGVPVENVRIPDFLTEADCPRLQEQFEACIGRGFDVVDVEYQARRGDRAFPVRCAVSALETGGIRLGLLAAFRDITHEQAMELTRRRMSQRLEFFFDKMPLGCMIWDNRLTVQEWNESAEEIFGWSGTEVIGLEYTGLLAERKNDQVLQDLRDLLQCKGTRRRRCRNRTRDARLIETEWFHTSLVNDRGETEAVASIVLDLTRQIELEEQLRQAQKMEAIGLLTAGMTHDFNNLLTTVLGNLALARMQLGRTPIDALLQDAETTANRAAELTRDLLQCVRKEQPALEPVCLTHRLAETTDLFRYSIGSRLDLKVSIAPDLWTVEADEGQIGQVVMNLCINARDAIGEAGCIEVSAHNCRLDAEFCRSRPWAVPGDYIRIQVADDGPGIEPAALSRIFEPFFTTKPVGKGSGLGLSVVYGIIKDHRGGVDVASVPGEGATFRVYLPRSKDSAPDRSQESQVAAGEAAEALR